MADVDGQQMDDVPGEVRGGVARARSAILERSVLAGEPDFHAHDYGADTEIEVSEGVQSLGREARLRPVGDSDAGSDDDLTDEEGDGGRSGSMHRRDDG